MAISQKTKEITDHLKKAVNWNKVFSLIHTMGDDFNDQQWRFFKSIIIERGIATYCENDTEYKMIYVGNDIDGCDLHFIILQNASNIITIEVKFVADAFYKNKGGLKDNQSVKLLNSHGTNKHTNLPTSYADYLIIVGKESARIIDKISLDTFLKRDIDGNCDGDGIVAVIPTSELECIKSPSDVVITKFQTDIKSGILKLVDNLIGNIV